jgi:integrase
MNLIEARAYHLHEIQRILGHAEDHPTLRLYGLYERRLLEYLDGNRLDPELAMLNPHIVAGCQGWIHEHHGYGVRGGRQAELAFDRIMKIWSAFLAKRRIIPVDLMLGFVVPKVPKIRRRPFSEDEAQAIMAAVRLGASPVRDRALMLVLSDTGCRVGELCGLTIDDVVATDGSLRKSIAFRKTKGGVPRDVVIQQQSRKTGGRCMEALRAWLKVRVAQPGVVSVFTTFDGWPLSERRVREMHAAYGAKARIHPCHPHMWRHTHATEALAEGVPENSIRDRLGHISPIVLNDYLHQSDRTRDIAAERASLSEKWRL